jgi:hypothetical protein
MLFGTGAKVPEELALAKGPRGQSSHTAVLVSRGATKIVDLLQRRGARAELSDSPHTTTLARRLGIQLVPGTQPRVD